MAGNITFWQRLMMDYPDLRELTPNDKQVRCPVNYGYEVKQRGQCTQMSCEQCWNRAMPGKHGRISA